VTGAARRGELHDPGPAILRIGRALDQTLVGQLVEDRDQPGLVIPGAGFRFSSPIPTTSLAGRLRSPARCAFSRVLPNGDGSEYLFTLLFAPDVDETAVEAQMAVVDQELEAVRALCEPPA
jgi:hypothetical protein